MTLRDQNDIDKLFNSKLVEKKFEVTPEHLNEINRQLDALPPAKKRRGLLIVGSILGLLLILSFGIYLLNDSKADVGIEKSRSAQKNSSKRDLDSNTTVINETAVSSSQENTDNQDISSNKILKMESGNQNSHDSNLIATDQASNEQGSSDSNANETDQASKEQDSNDSNANASDQASKEKGSNDSNANATDQTSKEKGSYDSNANATDQASNEKGSNDSNANATDQASNEQGTSDSNANATDQASKEQGSSDSNANATDQASKEKASSDSNANATDQASKEQDSNDSNVNASDQASKEQDSNDSIVNATDQASNEKGSNDSIVNATDQAVIDQDFNDSIVNGQEQGQSNPVKPNSGSSTPYWSFQASAGGSVISKKVIGGSTNYLTKRTDEEENIFTPQFDLGVNYTIGRLSVSTGLNYIQYGETIKYSAVISDTTYISSYTNVTDTAGNVISVPNYTTISQTDSTLISANGNNRHTYLTIPLSVGYRFDLARSNFSITPKTGIGLRFLVNGNGRYASADLNTVIEEKDKTFSLGYHGSIEFAYHLRKMSFFVAPNYNAAMRSFNSLHQYRSIGGMIGIIYHP